MPFRPGIGFFVTQQILTTVLPARIGASSLTVVLFAFGALTYARTPRACSSSRSAGGTQRFERLFFTAGRRGRDCRPSAQHGLSTSHANG